MIKGEGIASYIDSAVGASDDSLSKGDLYIMFDIKFPTELPKSQQERDQLVKALTCADQ